MDPAPIPIVRVIIEDEKGRFLFLKRSAEEIAEGTWCLPGGRIEPGENPANTAVREMKEETDLEVTEVSFLYDQIDEPYGRKVHAHNFCVKARGTVTLNSESTDFAWIAAEDLGNYPLTDTNEAVLRRYLAMKTRHEKRHEKKSRRD